MNAELVRNNCETESVLQIMLYVNDTFVGAAIFTKSRYAYFDIAVVEGVPNCSRLLVKVIRLFPSILIKDFSRICSSLSITTKSF